MKKLLLGAFFALFMLFRPALASAHEFETFPWLVKVQSTYVDQAAPGATVTFSGHGFIMETLGKQYVFTASHLSQGGRTEGKPNLVLQVFDAKTRQFRPIYYTKRLAKNRNDVEVIELKPGQNLEAFGQYQAPEEVPGPLQAWYPAGRFVLLSKYFDAFRDQSRLAPPGYVNLGANSFLPQISLLAAPFKSPFDGLTPKDAESLYNAASSFFSQNQIKVGFDIGESELTSNAEIHPGMSGLPLISHVDYDPYMVIPGLVVASSRGFLRSWFANTTAVMLTLAGLAQSHVSDVLSPEQASFLFGDTSWYCRSGLLYRAGTSPPLQGHQYSFQEAAFARDAAGNGTRSDGGNGTRSDGGNHPGPQLPDDLKTGVLFYEANQAVQRAVAFDVTWMGKEYLLPGELSTINWILGELEESHLTPKDIHPIRPADDLATAIWKQSRRYFGKSGDSGAVHVPLKMDIVAPLEKFKGRDVSASVTPNAAGVAIELNLGTDDLVFQLGHQGELIGGGGGRSDAGFVPEIEVKGDKTGSLYRIDLSSFLMVSPSFYIFGWDRISAQMQGGMPNPLVRFQVKTAGHEYIVYSP